LGRHRAATKLTIPDKARATTRVDIVANRAARKWTRRELIARVLWETLHAPLFAWTPRPLWIWRRIILRAFGARIGAHVHIHPRAHIQIPWNLVIDSHAAIGDRAIIYNLGIITIGKNATISQNAHLCAGSHDFRDPAMTLLKPPITIGAGVWICADAFIGPGVWVHDGAVVGARAVVMRDVAESTVVAGNPAIVIGAR
jgi:putative colanic acid biosynthesis acetyltransferase WcaF